MSDLELDRETRVVALMVGVVLAFWSLLVFLSVKYPGPCVDYVLDAGTCNQHHPHKLIIVGSVAMCICVEGQQ